MATVAGLYLAQVVFPSKTLLPKDSVVNTLWFKGPASEDESTLLGLGAAVEQAFKSTSPLQVDDWMAGCQSGALIVNVYDWGTAPPREPVEFVGSFTVTTAEDALPNEVAMCLSFATTVGPSVPRGRGRIFLGPLRTTVLDYDVNLEPRIHASFISTVVDLGQEIYTRSATAGFEWAVYSRVVNIANPVQRVWCDNAFDTQRRRGTEADDRQSLTLV